MYKGLAIIFGLLGLPLLVHANQSPVAHAINKTLKEDKKVKIRLKGKDPERKRLRYTISQPPQFGAVTLKGKVATYKPYQDYFGVDNFQYTVNDGEFDSAPVTVYLKIKPINDAPIAEPQNFEIAVGVTSTFPLAVTDAENDTLSYRITVKPKKGKVVLNGDSFTYTPIQTDYQGKDSFVYKVKDGKKFSKPARVDLLIGNFAFSTMPDPEKMVFDPEGGVYPVNQLLVALKDDVSRNDAENLVNSVSGKIVGFFPSLNMYQFEVPSNSIEQLESIIGTLESDVRVESVLTNNNMLFFNENKTDLAYLRIDDANKSKAYDIIKIEEAWNAIESKKHPLSQVTVGIIDTGIQKDHQEFVGVNISGAFNDKGSRTECLPNNYFNPLEKEFSHGTAVAGIIGANNASATSTYQAPQMNGILSGNSNLKYKLILGFSNPESPYIDEKPGSSIYPYQKLIEDILQMERQGVQIINMSFGYQNCGGLPADANQMYWKAGNCTKESTFKLGKKYFEKLLAKTKNVLFVAAAGNGYHNNTDCGINALDRGLNAQSVLPAGVEAENLITVGAIDTDNLKKISYSNFGDAVQISAPVGVWAPHSTDYVRSGYDFFGGTSATAPMVTGVAGLIKAISPELTPAEIKQILITTGQKPTIDQQIGPRLDALAAVCHPQVLNCTGKINDTGITYCVDSNTKKTCPVSDFPGQDAEQGRDATHNDDSDGHAGFSFTKLGSSGNPLPASAGQWNCVKDNVTGLIWEVKVDDLSHLRHQEHMYTWYQSNLTDGSQNPDNEDDGVGYFDTCNETLGDKRCNTKNYVAAVNDSGLCGFYDWRMPSAKELEGIADFSHSNPAIDAHYFPNTPSYIFLSDTANASFEGYPWLIRFEDGSAQSMAEKEGHVRLVRGASQ